jgi:hypothetical protein
VRTRNRSAVGSVGEEWKAESLSSGSAGTDSAAGNLRQNIDETGPLGRQKRIPSVERLLHRTTGDLITLAGVQLRPVGRVSGIRHAISRPGRSLSDFDRLRNRSKVAGDRRVVLQAVQ